MEEKVREGVCVEDATILEEVLVDRAAPLTLMVGV